MQKFRELVEVAKLVLIAAALFLVWPLTSVWKATRPPSSRWHEHYYPRAEALRLAAPALLLYFVLVAAIYAGVWPLWVCAILVYLYLTLLRMFLAFFCGGKDDEEQAYA